MPKVKDIRHFPPEFLDYTEKAGVGGEKMVVPIPDSKTGWKLRGAYYAFIGALRRQAYLYEVAGDDSLEARKIMDLAKVSFRVMVYLEPQVKDQPNGPWTCTWQNRENSWQEQLLQGAKVVKDTRLKKVDLPPSLAALVTKPEGGRE